MHGTYTIWFNPACSKCRETLELLRDHGIEPTLRKYLEEPPTIHELQALLRATGGSALALVRQSDPRFAELGLSDGSSEQSVLAALAAHPALLQRPIVTEGDRAIVARPPEKALELLR
jgi:arsenate reductase